MDGNLFNNYININYNNEGINKYINSEKYIYDDDKILLQKYNNRYMNNIFYKKNNTTNIKDKSNNHKLNNNYKKKFLYNSYNNELHETNNYKINYYRNNKNLSKSIKQNEENQEDYYSNINDSYMKSNNEYLRKSNNQNILNNNRNFYSAMNPINKNIKNKMRNINKDIISNNTDLINNNFINKESIIDRNQFMKNIKEIDDLDNIDMISDDANNNLMLKINNININENKIINLNKIDEKINNNYIKNVSEKKDINNYNRINLNNRINNNNLLMKQKNINTEKKGDIRYSKKLSDNIKKNNLSDNKNDILNKKNIISTGYYNENLKNFHNNHNNLLVKNNYKTYIKLEEKNNKVIKLRNSNYAMYGKKFSEKLNISPSQKRFSTLTNDKQEENNNLINEDYDFGEIYEQLINQRNINIKLRKKIEILNKDNHKKDNFIRKLYKQNEGFKKMIQKIKKDNEVKQKINKDLLAKINSYKNEILLLKNKVKYNLENNKLMHQYEHENNNLKMLLTKNKERQYSTDISKNNIFNSFINLDEQSKDYSNYREYNKSVSFSKSKTKINIPIFKRYQEDKENNEIKSVTEKNNIHNYEQ